jgi:hypothetical protein
MNDGKNWNGQNIPRIRENPPWEPFAILPVLECLLQFNEDTVGDLLPSEDSYGWGDSFMNASAWANNFYRITYIEPEFTRYGCLPRWFPDEDRLDRRLTDQGRVDRFLYLLDQAIGGLLDDHTQIDAQTVAAGILELHDNFADYVSIEEDEGMEWELAADQ